MKNKLYLHVLLAAASLLALSFARPDKEFKIYQFPRYQIPRIDGDFSDWKMVPDSFIIGINELENTVYQTLFALEGNVEKRNQITWTRRFPTDRSARATIQKKLGSSYQVRYMKIFDFLIAKSSAIRLATNAGNFLSEGKNGDFSR